MSRPKLTETRRRALMLIYLIDEDRLDVEMLRERKSELNRSINFQYPHTKFYSLTLSEPVTLQSGMVIPRTIRLETYNAILRGHWVGTARSGALLTATAFRHRVVGLTPRGMHKLKCRPEFEELRALKCMRLL